MIAFDEQEQLLITQYSKHDGWKAPEVEGIKRKIRNHFISIGITPCCYCRRSMHKQHKLDIDTEHILPKSSFPQYTFEIRNLNISCKRCNMEIKKEDTEFFLGDKTCVEPFKSEYYLIIHPNLDISKNHLRYISEQSDDTLIVKYEIVNDSKKGNATYKYFRLKELEYNSIDEAQKLAVITPELPSAIADELAEILNDELAN